MDRRNAMLEEFQKAGLDVQFIDAIDAETLKIQHQTSFFTPGMVGCFLSHKRLLEEISRSEVDVAVIFEDDISLDHWKNADLQSIPADFDIAFLSWYAAGKFKFVNANEKWLKCTEGHLWGFHTYAVNPQGARKIAEMLNEMKEQVDVQTIKAIVEERINGYFAKRPASQQMRNKWPSTVQRRG